FAAIPDLEERGHRRGPGLRGLAGPRRRRLPAAHGGNRVKFKLDENMPRDLAIRLHEAGHDVVDVVEEDLGGEEDPPVLQAATEEGRILLTFDLGFADIRHYPPGTHAGIVVFRLQDQRWRTLEGPAKRLLAGGRLEDLEKGLAIVDETRVRCKRAKK